MANQNGLILNSLFSMLLKKIIVPKEFHEQVASVKEMLKDDMSGLVDSLTDFAVDSASVDFSIETNNENFTEIMRQWLVGLNINYQGKIPSGIKPLAKEYFKERWKYSSFPVLKIQKWESIKGVMLPTQMYFVDGGSIYAKDKDEKNNELSLFGYDYYLGRDMKHELDKNVIFAKTNGRWFTKYPTPFIIKRGIYHNWKIIESLKDKQTTILDQIIPYLLLVKKGSEGLATSGTKTYSDSELKKVIADFQKLMNEIRSGNFGDTQIKTPIRAVNYDEELKNVIPDLSTIFEPDLFVVAERNILSGLGFIDVIEATSTSRRESILNPKVFIGEVTTGVEDFKQILKDLIFIIIEKNKKHKKWINGDFYITASPISVFRTDDFKNQMRLMWERGQISNQTYCEVVGETSYRTEKLRRNKEAKEGDDYTMYPHIRENREGVGIDIPGKDTDKDGNPIPTDKLDDKDKYNVGKYEAPVKCPKCKHIFDMLAETEAGMGWVKCPKCGEAVTQKNIIKSKEKDLEIAPYQTIKSLPDSVKKKLSPSKQKSWMKIFNNAYSFYMKKYKDAKKAESLAFRTAWSQIKQVKSKKKSKKK